jgi:hypothetical protein
VVVAGEWHWALAHNSANIHASVGARAGDEGRCFGTGAQSARCAGSEGRGGIALWLPGRHPKQTPRRRWAGRQKAATSMGRRQ